MNARRPAIVPVLALTLLGLACGEAEDPLSELPPAGAEECPHAWDWTDGQRRNIEAFTGGRDDVFAFNDCQRFLVGSRANPAYGAVFAIFIGDQEARTGGRARDGEMRAVALIAARGSYPQLGVRRAGFHCLLMDGRAGPSAMMAPAGPGANCRDPVRAEGHTLYTVRRGVEIDRTPPVPSDVPGVARWGFDGIPGGDADARNEGWVQYAILPCGDAVCYVGPTDSDGSGVGFAPKSPRSVLAGISEDLPSDGRTRRIDGWHDTQFLADPRSSEGRTRPHEGLPVGVVMPDPALGGRTAEDFDGEWIRVAEVAISASSLYEEKLNFAATTAAAYNVVELCSFAGSGERPERCEGIPAEVEKRCERSDPRDPAARRWRQRHINAETGIASYHCVNYRPHVGDDLQLDVPGVVRWQWFATDEMAWLRCPGGCCTG